TRGRQARTGRSAPRARRPRHSHGSGRPSRAARSSLTTGPQPGGQGQAAAGARGAVAEEMARDGASRDVGGVDPGAGHAGQAEGVAVGGAQVEQPAAGSRRVGWMNFAAAGPKGRVTAWWTSG